MLAWEPVDKTDPRTIGMSARGKNPVLSRGGTQRAILLSLGLVVWALPAGAAPATGRKLPFSADEAAAAAAAKNESRKPPPRKTESKPGRRAAAKPEALEQRLLASEQPPTAEELRALGPKTDERLIALAKGNKANLKLADRAMSALAFAPTPAAIRFLEEKVGEIPENRDAKTLPTLRRAAIALGWIAPASAPALLERLYDHPEPAVRADASLALGLTRLPDAATVLRKRLQIEPDDGVRALIARQLQVVESALLPARTKKKPAQ